MDKKSADMSPKKRKHLCNVCHKYIIGNSFFFKAHLYQHKLVKPRFSCPHCSKQYFRKDVFKKHLEVHTGRKNLFTCDYCGRAFVDKRNLIVHFKVHDDGDGNVTLPRYKCIACGMSYCEERLLKYHIRKVHFNLQQKEDAINKKQPNETWIERVLETDVCVQITKVNNNVITIKKCGTIKEETKKESSDQFVTYMNSVFGCNDKSQYSKAICDYCNKEMLKKSLQNHMRERHLNVRKFKCDTCNRSFNRHYQMMNHKCGKKVRRSFKNDPFKMQQKSEELKRNVSQKTRNLINLHD